MEQVLTGIQSSGDVHLGNIVGAIEPALQLGLKSAKPPLLFIADLHSLTTTFAAEERIRNVKSVAAAWIALGAEEQGAIIYRQSKIPEVSELTWYLSCFTPYGLLKRSHSFKDKVENLSDINAGLFTYPVLMAADMLLYNATHVPVGKDQKQHIEITRDLARYFNNRYGDILVPPDAVINEDSMIVPGIDGRKMSKSYGNYIDIFLNDNDLKKSIARIVTDSRGVNEKKDPATCNVFRMYSLIAKAEDVEGMRDAYLKGKIGYGESKRLLLEAIKWSYGEKREVFWALASKPQELEEKLIAGEQNARIIAKKTIRLVREELGF